jgi:hypothetical protein
MRIGLQQLRSTTLEMSRDRLRNQNSTLSDETERLDELKERIQDSNRQEQPDQELILGSKVKTRGL